MAEQHETTTAAPAGPTMPVPVPPEMAGLPPREPLNSNEILFLGSRNGSGYWVNDMLRRAQAQHELPDDAPERIAAAQEWQTRGEIDELDWEGQWADWSYVGWHIAAFHARRAAPKAGEA